MTEEPGAKQEDVLEADVEKEFDEIFVESVEQDKVYRVVIGKKQPKA